MALIKAFGSTGETDPPTGHGVGFRYPGHRERAILQVRRHLGEGRVLKAFEHQMLIHVVGQHPDMRVFAHHFGNLGNFSRGAAGPSRIVWIIEDQPLGAGGDGGVDVLRARFEAIVLRAVDQDRHALTKLGHLRIGDPGRHRDNDFITGIDRGHDGIEQALLAAVGHPDLVQRIVQARIALELALDRLLQDARAILRRIFRIAGKGGFMRGLDRMRRTVEIGLARGQGDHRLAGGLQLARLDCHLNAGCEFHATQAMGKSGHQCRPWQKR